MPTGYILKVPYKSSGWDAESAKLKSLKAASKGNGDSGRTHKVRKGQTACGIARRYKVRCKDVIRLNKLNRKAVVKIGQRLKIPGGVQKYRLTSIVKASQELRLQLASQTAANGQDTETSAANASEPAVQNDTVNTAEALSLEQTPAITTPPAQVAEQERLAVATAQTTPSSNVDDKKLVQNNTQNNINPANEVPASKPIKTEKPAAGKSEPLNQLINLDTSIYERNSRHWVNVLPSESLGLYADWLGIGSSRVLRRMNKLGGKADIDVYQRIYLPPMTNQQKQNFKLSRNEYHLELQLQYFQRFKIAKVKKRKVRANETMWSVSKNNRIPMWLLMQYNKEIKRGKTARIPIIKPKK